MDNVEEMDKFVEKYNFPKLDQEEIENLNRPITSMEIETVIKNLPTKDDLPFFVLYPNVKDSENGWALVSRLNPLTLSCSIQSVITSLECTRQKITVY